MSDTVFEHIHSESHFIDTDIPTREAVIYFIFFFILKKKIKT